MVGNVHWCAHYELTNPLRQQDPPEAQYFSDPIDVLRLDLEALDALPPNTFKWLVIRGCLQVARDHLAKQEDETAANLAEREALRASDQRILDEVSDRLAEHSNIVLALKRELSEVRWAKRNPLVAEAQQEQPKDDEFGPQFPVQLD